jgi:ribose transport system substrate-binding protein
LLIVFVAVVAIVATLWFTGQLRPAPKLALVTAGSGPYWDMIVRGAEDAARRERVKLTVVRPASDEPTQSAAIKQLLDGGYDGIAVSPNDAVLQAALLADVAAETNLVTYDSDCPVAKRLCFVGTDNYDAGRVAAQHLREALPEGGDVILAIGSLEKANGQRRRQGVIDELLERSYEPGRPMDPVDDVLKGPKYTIVATLVDHIDPKRAHELAAEALKKHTNLKAAIGLFASNTPALLQALAESDKLGKVKVVGFDTNEQTLAGIEAGHVYATIMQDPYYMGFETVRLLADATTSGGKSLPLYQETKLACDPVTQANVAQARADLARKLGAPPPATPSTHPAS